MARFGELTIEGLDRTKPAYLQRVLAWQPGLPYDQRQNALLHEAGLRVVNHFCGGLMPMLDLVLECGNRRRQGYDIYYSVAGECVYFVILRFYAVLCGYENNKN